MPSDDDQPVDPAEKKPGTPVLVWVVIAILVAIALSGGRNRIGATVAVVVFFTAARLGRYLSAASKPVDHQHHPVSADRRGVSMPQPFTLFIVRHGQTPLNADGRVRGHADIELDSVGQLEAARLANVFAHVPLTRIVSSPLLRAQETAAPIALTHDIVVDIDVDLIDRDYGPWTGQPRVDVEERYGSLYHAPGVELSAQLETRLLRAFNRLVETSATTGPVMLIGHDATNAALIRLLVPDVATPGRIEQHTGCWNRLELAGGRWKAVNMNQIPTDTSPAFES